MDINRVKDILSNDEKVDVYIKTGLYGYKESQNQKQKLVLSITLRKKMY